MLNKLGCSSNTVGLMSHSSDVRQSSAQIADAMVVDSLRHALEEGHAWPTTLLKAIASWSSPMEEFRGRIFTYFIGGEAFDWILLAERLLLTVGDIVPAEEIEKLLFTGKFPRAVNDTMFKNILGIEKYRGVLNYHYGVTVEESLQLAVEVEIQKRQLSNGERYNGDPTDEAFFSLYRATPADLLRRYREEMNRPDSNDLSFGEAKAFTYWLFKYRLQNSDKARTASDTRKGLSQIEYMGGASLT